MSDFRSADNTRRAANRRTLLLLVTIVVAIYIAFILSGVLGAQSGSR